MLVTNCVSYDEEIYVLKARVSGYVGIDDRKRFKNGYSKDHDVRKEGNKLTISCIVQH